MGYSGQKIWDILDSDNRLYYGQYLSKLLDIILKIYICQKLVDIFGKKYGIYWAKIIICILGYIGFKLLDIFGKTMGYTCPIDILIKIYGTY